MEKTYTDLKKKEEKHNEIEYTAAIPVEVIEVYVGRALARAAEGVELPGFRKGKVPLDMVRARMDEMALLEDAADEALRTAVREILTDEKLSIVGAPQLTLTKIAPKNPIEFKVRFGIYPTIKLPDYKKIAADIVGRPVGTEADVTDADMNEAITRLVAMISLQNPELDKDKDKKPELTDAMVAKLGPFANVEDFKIKLKENLRKDKSMQAKEARREEVMTEIVKAASVEIPKMLLDQEWGVFEERRDEELKQAKIALADYLKQTNKTEAQLEKEERAFIEQRIKTSMVFREIQKAENVTATEKEIQTNIAYLKLQYPDRDENWLRETSESLIFQEKIFTLLGIALVEA